MNKLKIVVVGAGAAGLMAAARAAECGAEVVILEKMGSPARKLRITGKGRCNLTNIAEVDDFLRHFGRSGLFLRQAFSRFFSGELVDFLNQRGLATIVERGGRIFPADGDAPAVARLLIDWNRGCGVQMQTQCSVRKLLVSDGTITGVVCNGDKIDADRVIVATGGKSYPRTGSTGDGYALARAVGHTVTPIKPALVPLIAVQPDFGAAAGLTLKNIKARLYLDQKRKGDEFGELSFTTNGLSGPIILTMSAQIVDALQAGSKVAISLDLKPALDDAKLEARLLRDLHKRGQEPMSSILRGMLPKELVEICLRETGIDSAEQGNRLRAGDRKRLRVWLKDCRIEISGYGTYDEAIITSGGVDTREIDPMTMQSKIVKGLYFIGELLDVQADTGGYNLQAAFSTGWVAGESAARSLTSAGTD